MNSEKVKEIKKAVECCKDLKNPCRNCPYHDRGECIEELTLDMGDYINELESDNERLSSRHRNLKINYNKTWKQYREYEVENQQLKDRIAELEEYIEGNEQDAKAFVNGWHKDLETELKQFAERLKEMAYKSTDWSHGEHPLVVEVDYIDETLNDFWKVEE